MQSHPGLFIVLEGSDGSGKATQFKLLEQRLRAAGYSVVTFDFPRYSEDSSYFVRKYLAGDYGPAGTVNPYTASMFYALDRYEASQDIRKTLSGGAVVLSNRFVGSNMAHQGSKFSSDGEQRGFFMWEDSLEFQLLGIPRPNLNIFLHLPAEVSQRLILKRAEQNGTEPDEHEKDLDHLRRSVEAYELLCRLFPKDFSKVQCAPDGRLLDVKTISNLIWQLIKPLLSGLPKHQPRPRTIKLGDPSLTDKETLHRSDNSEQPGLSGVSYLTKRLLLSVQGIKIIEKQPIDGSPRPITQIVRRFPKETKELAAATTSFLEQLEKNLRTIKPVNKEATKAVKESLMPLYFKSDYSIEGSISSLQEAEVLLKKAPAGHTDSSNSKIIEDINPSIELITPGVKLLGWSPRNEIQVLAKILFPKTDVSEEQLLSELERVSYEQKTKWLKEMIGSDIESFISGPSKFVEYNLEIVASGHDIEKLLELAKWRNVYWQLVSPTSGYPIPALVDELGLGEAYSECFDSSLRLYSSMQSAGITSSEAQYASLRGHYSRVNSQMSLDQLFLLAKRVGLSRKTLTSTNPGLLLEQILSAIEQNHPLLVKEILKYADKSVSRKKIRRQAPVKPNKR